MEAGLFRGAAAASAILAAIAGKLFTQACAKHAKARTLHSAGLGRRRLPGPRARRSRGSRNRRSSSIRGILLEAREPWRRGRGGRLLRLKQAVLQHRQSGNMSSVQGLNSALGRLGLTQMAGMRVGGEWFLEGKPSSAGNRNAELLDGKYYWYKSKVSVSKLCDGSSFCCPVAARNS